jgi:EAL and modified HD-GYP domain-containing signal transduction protein
MSASEQPLPTPPAEPARPVFVARQPILEPGGQVYGYELLYRAGADDTACATANETVDAHVLTDALLTIGLDMLTNGRPAFFNLTRPSLLSDAATLFPAATSVLEIGRGVGLDAEVVEACRRLHDLGFTLLLDDYAALGSAAETLLPFVKFVKIDVHDTPPGEVAALGRRLAHRVRLVATRVETADALQAARAAGFVLFQGYYFCRPVTIKGATPPARRATYLRLLAAINQPDVTLGELEELVKQDVSLCYRVLRCINSAAFGLQMEIHSIRQALVLLGVGQVRKWASVWSLASAQQGGMAELLPIAIIRARCCEILGTKATAAHDPGLFLLGMCSLLDAMLGKPMTAALADLPLAAEIRDALLGRPNQARAILDIVVAYERGCFEEALSAALRLGVDPGVLPAAYGDALRYARELSRDVLAA